MSYETILEAARNRDEVALKQALILGPIDEFKEGCCAHSAATQLALEGDKEGIQFLQRFGANTNWIAVGAAQSGDRAYAEELRIQHGADINAIAMGAAQGGHYPYAEELRDHGADINVIAEGAGRGGDSAYAEKLLLHGADINFIAEGAARGGHRAYAEKLRTQEANVDCIARGAAQGGHHAYAEELRTQGANVDYIAQGAAAGGYHVYAEELHRQGANIDYIAQGAAVGGHHAYAEELRTQGANVDCIAIGALIGGHFTYVEELCIQHGASIDGIAENLVQRGNFSNIQRAEYFLFHIKTDKFRNQLLITALCKQDIPQNVKDALPAISKKINGIHTLSKSTDITLSQAKQWQLAFANQQRVVLPTNSNDKKAGLSVVILQIMPALMSCNEHRPALSADICFCIGRYIWSIEAAQVKNLMFAVFKGSLNYSLKKKIDFTLYRMQQVSSSEMVAEYQRAATWSNELASIENLSELQSAVKKYLPIDIENEELMNSDNSAADVKGKEPVDEDSSQAESDIAHHSTSSFPRFFHSTSDSTLTFVGQIAEKAFYRMNGLSACD